MVIINALDLLGSGLVLAGLVWGGRSLSKVYSRLKEQKAVVRSVSDAKSAKWASQQRRGERPDFDADRAAGDAEMIERGVPKENLPITGRETATLKQDIEMTVVDYLRPHLAWPFALASLGTAVSAVRALLLLLGVGS